MSFLPKRWSATIKELGRAAGHRVRPRRHLPHLAAAHVGERFTEIYASGYWRGGKASNPASGGGSSLEATETVRRVLPGLLRDIDAEAVLDVGCGDFTWMQTVSLALPYIGIDIVPSVIEENVRLHSGPRRRFVCLDAAVDELPAADVVLCREVLFHLSFADIRALLRNVLSKPRRYLIATTDGISLINSDIVSGDFRPLNLERAPFRFPPPVHRFSDGAVSRYRSIAVWDYPALKRITTSQT